MSQERAWTEMMAIVALVVCESSSGDQVAEKSNSAATVSIGDAGVESVADFDTEARRHTHRHRTVARPAALDCG